MSASSVPTDVSVASEPWSSVAAWSPATAVKLAPAKKMTVKAATAIARAAGLGRGRGVGTGSLAGSAIAPRPYSQLSLLPSEKSALKRFFRLSM